MGPAYQTSVSLRTPQTYASPAFDFFQAGFDNLNCFDLLFLPFFRLWYRPFFPSQFVFMFFVDLLHPAELPYTSMPNRSLATLPVRSFRRRRAQSGSLPPL